ncbi:addiction module toxin, RelE/StbE family [Stanieria cyanosphaera PCC 7437]|uniref:Addiction module toxin, RelE/StbE family n=1 Tax=Stanieria cyanosphaera (strain ATCC 29371 / PCC 7437) TaxID=111780 RepID=K9XR46_STAC7|nr:type II toxin-antitoxin system RelE/ParE family toxin [Stanieria cyanosphaera]AFZ34132.1 addiction module toxin, RelE/StbE family [Stanieria cyanosphaera PCC 7437]
MASYKIEWKQSAKKELKKLDKQIIFRILQAIEDLADNPYSSGSKKLIGSDSIYRIRVGDYRIIYNIKSSVLTIEIIKVGHRREIYRKQ